MKQIQIFSLLFFSILFSSHCQQLASADSINVPYLSKVIQNAYIDLLEEKETFIKVKDQYTFYIDLDKKKRYVLFNTNLPLKEGLDKAKILDYVNKVNAELIGMQCFFNEAKNRIYFFHYWWIEGGYIDEKVLVKTCKFYERALASAYKRNPEESLW